MACRVYLPSFQNGILLQLNIYLNLKFMLFFGNNSSINNCASCTLIPLAKTFHTGTGIRKHKPKRNKTKHSQLQVQLPFVCCLLEKCLIFGLLATKLEEGLFYGFFNFWHHCIIIYFILFYLTWTSSGKSVYTTGNRSALKLVTLPNLKVTRLKGDVTRNDSQRRFLAQHSVATLLRYCFEWLQCCFNIATLYCAKNCRCLSSRVTSP